MSTASRRKNTSVITKLTENPYEFPFLQAVRLLERSAVLENNVATNNTSKHKYTFNTQPVACFTPPITEAIRFSTNNALNFSSSEVSNISNHTSTNGKKNGSYLLTLWG